MKSKNLKKYRYKIYSINFESELEIPYLTQSHEEKVDAVIVFGVVPKKLPVIKTKGVLFEAAPNDFLFHLNQIGAFRVQNGNKITIEVKSGTNLEELSLFVLGSAISALLHQKNILPIHGCSVLSDSGAIVFTGQSSVGKSSLAAELHNRGFPILTDDVAAITSKGTGGFLIHPGIPYFKLWYDVITHMKNEGEYKRVRPHLKKYRVPIENSFCNEPRSLQKIVLLKTNNSGKFKMNEIFGIAKINTLINNTFRIQYVEGLGIASFHFNYISQIANQIPIFIVERPKAPLLIKELADFIVDSIIAIND